MPEVGEGAAREEHRHHGGHTRLAYSELQRVRWELKLLVSRRLLAPLSAPEMARFEALTHRELNLLRLGDGAVPGGDEARREAQTGLT